MVAQFGIWYLGNSRDKHPSLAFPQGHSGFHYDSSNTYADRSTSIAVGFSKHASSRSGDDQPYISGSNRVYVWDGRLDNRDELECLIEDLVSRELSDVALVARAFEKLGTELFRMLIGDWALTVWDAKLGQLTLARDYIGVRRLYYCRSSHRTTWSSSLEDLVRTSSTPLTLDERYLAGWLHSFPDASLTPYEEIQAVPPGSFIVFKRKTLSIVRYWSLKDLQPVALRSDQDYEAELLKRLFQAVGRRRTPAGPILAELSGGMDSAAIVCVADALDKMPEGGSPVHTISYFNEEEPHWDELPYVTAVEQQRGCNGVHVDVGRTVSSGQESPASFRVYPGESGGMRPSPITEWMEEHAGSILLSGIGGDEVLGGVPTPLPELENLLARGRIGTLIRRTMAWAIVQRRPWLHLIADTIAAFLPSTASVQHPWLNPDFVMRHASVFSPQRLRIFGVLPSVQEGMLAIESLRRQIAAADGRSRYAYAKSYPLLDRSLVEFMFSIPRDQVVRPGERRSLMRRAVRGIVPEVVLARRKGYVSRSPLLRIKKQAQALLQDELLLESRGLITRAQFVASVEAVCAGKPGPIVPLLRVITLERWLRELNTIGALSLSTVFPPALKEPPGAVNSAIPTEVA